MLSLLFWFLLIFVNFNIQTQPGNLKGGGKLFPPLHNPGISLRLNLYKAQAVNYAYFLIT